MTKKLLTLLVVFSAVSPINVAAQMVEISNVTMTTSDNQVITAGDATGKMVPIVGGETGREVFGVLTRMANDETLSMQKRTIADLLQTILLNRWRELAN